MTAIPITPYTDNLTFNPLQVAKVTVRSSSTGKVLAVQPKVVIPVSDEMRCDLCHGPADTAGNILQAHDAAHGTHLYADLQAGARHACSECHKDNALGKPGVAGVEPLSQAIHGVPRRQDERARPSPRSHALLRLSPRRATKCLRGRMAQVGFTCTSAGCHGDMANVADSQGPPTNREAWLQEPKCGGCHGALYAENPGQLYRNSYLANGPEGMNGNKIQCESCHGSPHAEWRVHQVHRQPGAAEPAGARDVHQALQHLPRRRERPHPRRRRRLAGRASSDDEQAATAAGPRSGPRGRRRYQDRRLRITKAST